MLSSRKDTAKSVKTLIVMLQSLRDQQVIVVLRNDNIVRGTLIKVDASMNLELKNASVEPDPFYETNSAENQRGEDIIPSIDENNLDSLANIQSYREVVCDKDQTDQSCDKDIDERSYSDEGMSEQGDGIDEQSVYDYFVVKGSRIRYIQLPDDNDLMELTKLEIERIRNKRKQWTKRDIIKQQSTSKLISDHDIGTSSRNTNDLNPHERAKGDSSPQT